MNNDDISHFSTIHASFAIKSNVYFIAHQYLIINNSQSQRALSVSVRTVLWIYFASRRNCGLLPAGSVQKAIESSSLKMSAPCENKPVVLICRTPARPLPHSRHSSTVWQLDHSATIRGESPIAATAHL